MFAIRLSDDLIEEIDFVAKKKHLKRSDIVRQAIIRYLEDIEDIEMALWSKKNSKKRFTLAEVRKELGLDD